MPKIIGGFEDAFEKAQQVPGKVVKVVTDTGVEVLTGNKPANQNQHPTSPKATLGTGESSVTQLNKEAEKKRQLQLKMHREYMEQLKNPPAPATPPDEKRDYYVNWEEKKKKWEAERKKRMAAPAVDPLAATGHKPKQGKWGVPVHQKASVEIGSRDNKNG